MLKSSNTRSSAILLMLWKPNTFKLLVFESGSKCSQEKLQGLRALASRSSPKLPRANHRALRVALFPNPGLHPDMPGHPPSAQRRAPFLLTRRPLPVRPRSRSRDHSRLRRRASVHHQIADRPTARRSGRCPQGPGRGGKSRDSDRCSQSSRQDMPSGLKSCSRDPHATFDLITARLRTNVMERVGNTASAGVVLSWSLVTACHSSATQSGTML